MSIFVYLRLDHERNGQHHEYKAQNTYKTHKHYIKQHNTAQITITHVIIMMMMMMIIIIIIIIII
jgi:hypothetical protein